MIYLNELQVFLDMVLRFQSHVDNAIDDIRSSYEVLKEQESDLRYQLSLSYLSMSWQSYLEARKLYIDPTLDVAEAERFFNSYNIYKSTLKRFINRKEQNNEWLDAAYKQLIKHYHVLDELHKKTASETILKLEF